MRGSNCNKEAFPELKAVEQLHNTKVGDGELIEDWIGVRVEEAKRLHASVRVEHQV